MLKLIKKNFLKIKIFPHHFISINVKIESHIYPTVPQLAEDQHYGLSGVFPKFIYWSPTLQCEYLETEPFKSVMKIKWGFGGGGA